MLCARKYSRQAAIYYGVSHKGTGLENKVVPDDKHMGKAVEMAHNIAQHSPFSVPLTLAANLMIYLRKMSSKALNHDQNRNR